MIARLGLNAGIPLKYANRHGLITGPTGTGKTVSLMTLAESFSAAGVPVFAPDVKGDLTALARSCQTRLYDPFNGMRVELWRFGPDLLARALNLSDTQAGCLEVAFAYADDIGAPLDTLEHVRVLLTHIGASPESVAEFGHVTRASVGTIQRAFLRLEKEGAGAFFGPSTFDLSDILENRVSLLKADRLLQTPRLYGALLLYLLRELQARLPESGDMAKPRLVFMFDEAHTVFADCPAHLLRAIEATARLIRSKGVGIYFASQEPGDVPDVIRAQCATVLEHKRELGVGRAEFVTLDRTGKPTTPRVIKPDLPKCPLQPVDMAPYNPVPVEPESVDMTRAGYLFLAAAGLALCGLVAGAVGVVQGGYLPGAVAVVAGAWLALRR